MTTLRRSISDFALANPIYIGARVTFYTVDPDTGLATTTLATLYAGRTGATTAGNPQTLDGFGKFAAPVYCDVSVIGEIVSFNAPTHRTGPIQMTTTAESGLVYNVMDYGPNDNDITEALRRARDDMAFNGGGTLWIPPVPGGFIATSVGAEAGPVANTTCLLGDNMFVDGGGTIDFQTTTNESCLFGFNGVGQGSYTLSVDAVMDANSITVTDTTGLAVNFVVELTGNDSNGDFHFSAHRIKSLPGAGVVKFYSTLPWDWTAASTTIDIIDGLVPGYLINGGGIRNLHLTGSNALAPNLFGIYAIGTMNQRYENLFLEGFCGSIPATGSSGGFSMFDGYENVVRDIHCKRGGSEGINDIHLHWQARLMADNLDAEAPVGFGIGFGWIADAVVGRLMVHGMSDKGRPVKVAGALRSQFGQIQSIGSKNVGIAISVATKNCTFDSLLLRGNPDADDFGNRTGIWFSDENNTGNTINFADVSGFADINIATFASDTGNYIRALTPGGNLDTVNNIFNAGKAVIELITPGGTASAASVGSSPPVTLTGASGAQSVLDSALIINASGTFTLTLLDPTAYPGRWLTIKSIAAQAVNSASTNIVPIDSGTAGTAILAATAGKWANLQSDGTHWVVMASN